MDKVQKTTPTPHLVAYIDILGSKNYLKIDENKFMSKMSRIYAVWNDVCKKEYYKLSVEIKMKIFSDNLVFTAQYSDENFRRVMRCFISTISVFQYRLFLDENILIRGGISDKSLFINDTFVCGDALIESYELESQIALYPRIVVSRKLFEKIQEIEPSKAKSHISVDFDGQPYLNFLHLASEDEFVYLKKMINAQINDLIDSSNCDNRILQKLYWLRHYIECTQQIS